MWFAYDTDTYESLVNLSYVEPSFSTLFYLHNNPTAPTSDTDAQLPLAMNTMIPNATTLYNYDQNLDSDAGRRLLKTTKGLTETNLSKHQMWRTRVLGSNLVIDGDVKLDLLGRLRPGSAGSYYGAPEGFQRQHLHGDNPR